MTAEAEEKAKELISVFKDYAENNSQKAAKQCALIAVQTVLDFIKEKFIPHAGAISYMQDRDYLEYQSIKSHLQNL